MKSEENRKPEEAFKMDDDEQDWRREHLMIRDALLRLPRVSCPIGFEYRLQQRITNGVGRRENRNPIWSWTGGFAAAGLGVAATILIAVFVFDFSFSDSGSANMAQSTGVNSSVVPQYPVAQEGVGQSSFTGSPERLVASDVQQKDALSSAVKDSLRYKRGTLPQGLYQVVDGSGR